MIGFKHQGIDPLRYAIRGRPCFSLSIAKDKREVGRYGDTDKTPLYRNQISEQYRHGKNELWDFNFSILIPEDFALKGRSAIAGTHSTYATQSLFYLLHKDDKIQLKSRESLLSDDLIIPDEWVDWKVSINMKDNVDGWLRVWRNEILVHEHNGIVLRDKNEEMYFKVGPYVWDNIWHGNYRTFFFQI